MKARKIIAMSMIAAMSISMLAGCGEKKEDGKEASDGKKKLTISTYDNDTSPQFKTAVEVFQEKNPDVEIEYIDTAANEYNNKLTVMLAGGDPDPDVIFCKDMGTQLTMQEKGQIECLDKYIEKDNIDLSVYNGIAEKLQIDGSQYTLPYRSDWYVLYYNKDLFDKAGIPYPSNDMTWDEYEELARQLTSGEGNDKIYGTHNHNWMALVCNWAIQDGKNTLVSDNYDFLKPYYEQALRMQKDGIVQDYATIKTGNLHYSSVFEQQQCAMMPMGTWYIANLIQAQNKGSLGFNWGFATIPHPEGVEAGNSVGAITPIAINANSDQKDLAWEFVKCATSVETAERLAEKGVLTVIQSEEIMNKVTSVEGFPEGCAEALELKGMVFDRPLDKDMEKIRKVLDEEHDLIMIEEESIDDGIKNMTERVKEIREANQ